MCTWTALRPGTSVLPPPSISRTASRTSPGFSTATIRPSRTRTSRGPSRSAARGASKTRTFRITKVFACPDSGVTNSWLLPHPASASSPRTTTRRHCRVICTSVVEGQLEEAVVGVLARKGLLDDGRSEGVPVVALDREPVEQPDGDRDVCQRRERAISVGRASGVAEEGVARRSAARVPEVASVRHPQPVEVAAYEDAIVRPEEQLEEDVARVHQVEEREPGVGARRRDQLEERAVHVVVRVVVPRRPIPPDPQPGRCGYLRELVTGLLGVRPPAVTLPAPSPRLDGAPGQAVQDTGSEADRRGHVPADGIDGDRLLVRHALLLRAIVHLERVLPRIAVVEVE